MEERLCLKCGKKLVGRLDKKFCDTQCKSEYNNQRKTEQEKDIIETNRILRKNRSILKKLSPVGKTTVRKEVLDSHGFEYAYFTSTYKNNYGDIYYIVYDYGYFPFTKDGVQRATIVNRQPYMLEKFEAWP